MSAFSKLLVANRGEIACRVLRSARRLGLRTVAVYSDIDASALHVMAADESIRIGPPPAAESYLSIPAVLNAAKRTGADAIHPGYGFLSENPDFALACAEAGVVFVGPTADAIRRMGNKAWAKRLALESGVRCIRGYEGEKQDDSSMLAEARKIGFPLLIKAAAGGGGRGMRRVAGEADFPGALAGARMEAKNAFGSDELILEELVENARHVEIQLIADSHGNYLTLGERDCSTQRRHQKIVEESPCAVMTAELRAAMSEAAKTVARAAGYVNAGTVEFLLDSKGAFYFLEVNTRLQVEHPVTEMVTGLDLVELQLRIARGEPLPLKQADVHLSGHAIEARLCAEDPSAGFLPQTGTVRRWSVASGAGVRIDHGVRTGSVISPFYDPMIAKIIAHGANREDARRRLLSAVREMSLFGVTTNLELLDRVLEHPVFVAGDATTTFLESSDVLQPLSSKPDLTTLAIACAAIIEHAAQRNFAVGSGMEGSTGPASVPIRISWKEMEFALRATHRREAYTVTLDDASVSIVVNEFSGERISWTTDGQGESAGCLVTDDRIYLNRAGKSYEFRDVTYAPPADAASMASSAIKSPMSGRVIGVRVAAGQEIQKGDVLVVVEAMKMENQVVATRDGVIEVVAVVEGAQVDANQLLVKLVEEVPPAAAKPSFEAKQAVKGET